MSSPDFDDIARLWQQEPSPAEQEAIEQLARKARRRARLTGFGDIAWAVSIAAIVILSVLAKPDAFTMAAGVLTIAVVAWLNWRRRSLRLQLTGADNRPAFIETSIRTARHNLRRTLLSLATFPPAILAAILFRASKDTGGRANGFFEALAGWGSSPRGIIVLIALTAGSMWLLRSGLNLRREIKRLEEMRRAYIDEAKLDERDSR